MQLLSFIQSLTPKLVLATLAYRKYFQDQSDERSADVGAEMAFLLLHLVDVQLFHTVGAIKRDQVFHGLAHSVIADYAGAVLRPEAPHDLVVALVEILLNKLNERQQTYARCRSLLGEEFPGAGSKIFALCFFVHRAIGRTTRTEVADVLAGRANIPVGELDDFPGVEALVRAAVFVGATLKELQLDDEVRALR